jgi:hypothetical protein
MPHGSFRNLINFKTIMCLAKIDLELPLCSLPKLSNLKKIKIMQYLSICEKLKNTNIVIPWHFDTNYIIC